ncbi:MAG: ribonuclease HII [Nanoarchaeota archaeon]
MYILGIDDAGRGPLIGSMFLAGVLIKKEDEKYLKAEGVADSKTLAHEKRMKLDGIIKDLSKNFKIVESTAEQIDHAIHSGVNLNTLEAIKTAEIINSLLENVKEKVKIIVDCPSVNTNAWKATLIHYIKDNKDFELHCEHKADANHISVSAASILAKCAREASLPNLRKKFGDFGSGYPSDPTTKDFLKKHGNKHKDSGIFRKSWATWKALYPESNKQKTLF